MSKFLLQHQSVDPITWAYLATLLIVALFFKFSRFWSVRNLDILLLLLAAPGLLFQQAGQSQRMSAAAELQRLNAAMAGEKPAAKSDEKPEGKAVEPAAVADARRQWDSGRTLERIGFIWMLAVSALYLIRLLLDSTMVRRPLLEPNLSAGGLIFLGVALVSFVVLKVVQGTPTDDDLHGARSAQKVIASTELADELRQRGPGFEPLQRIPSILTYPPPNGLEAREFRGERLAKGLAIACQLAILVGLIFVGYQHFNNVKMGIGAATFYLLLPYTFEMAGRVTHLLPGALLVWAVASYRRPLTAGVFLGAAMGAGYYPMFLLPLWISFYWPRGLARFLSGSLTTLGLMAASLACTAEFWGNVQRMFGFWTPVMQGLDGIWGLGWDPVFRIPILTAFVALAGSLALWPAQKNLGTLLSCSAAVMVAVQFWHGFGGGLYMAWYLPLTLLTVFRPNLEDRVALTVLSDRWFSRRRVANLGPSEKAA